MRSGFRKVSCACNVTYQGLANAQGDPAQKRTCMLGRCNTAIPTHAQAIKHTSTLLRVLLPAIPHALSLPLTLSSPCCPSLQKRPGTGSFIAGLTVSEPYCANTTNHELLRPEWKLLLSRVGDELMLLLLQHTSLFIPVGGLGVEQSVQGLGVDQRQDTTPAAGGAGGMVCKGRCVRGGANYLQLTGKPISDVSQPWSSLISCVALIMVL